MSELYGWLDSLNAEPVALATVISTSGSTYRKAGARLLIWPDGSYRGLMSGGCLEQEIARHGVEVLKAGEALSLKLDTRQYLGCDGALEIAIEPACPKLFEDLQRQLNERRTGLWLVTPGPGSGSTHISEKEETEAAFCRPLLPRSRLLVFGSGPDVTPILEMGRLLDWEVQQATHPGEPHNSVRRVHPKKVVETYRADPQTAVLVMTHHFGHDLSYISAFWDTPVSYLGCLGSRGRREKLLAELAGRDHDLEARPFHSPAGLKLQGEGPGVIALSVWAQLFSHEVAR